MINRIAIFLTLFLIPALGSAQFQFSYENQPEVMISGNPQALAWAGGLNAPQYSTADVNGDSNPDLVIFDRTNANIQTFLNASDHYDYAPQFERFFPEDLEGWVLLRDFDCDGDQDLFTRSPFGIRVYKNISQGNDPIEFELFTNIVFTQGNSGLINLQVNITDIPVIDDIDSDGDLDILTFDSGTGGNVEYHQNQTLENFGICDSLAFVRVIDRWGDFEECFCQDFAFGETCEEKNGGRVLHASGKALLTLDFDDDGDKDLVYGDESCNEIMYLENVGDANTALITDFTIDFPNATDPVFFSTFPATFYEDVTFDGVKDLIFAPNVFSNFTGDIDLAVSSRLYTNNGSPQSPDFQLSTTQFLQEEMIDLGERAAPAFADWDGDGDLDMIMGYDGLDNGSPINALAYYDNTGTPTAPVFTQTDLDLENFSGLQLLGLRPYITDLDQDNIPDLILSGTDNPPILKVYFFKNSAAAGEPFNINNTDRVLLNISLNTSDNIAFFDGNLDGAKDILVGTSQGNLEYHINTSVFNYELIQSDYAGIGTDPERPSLVPFVIDLDQNNEPELITLDRSGKLRVFEDVRLSATPAFYEELISHEDGQPLVPSSFGDRTVISSADLFGDGFPPLVMGTSQGGVLFLQNESSEGPPTSENITFSVYPNPTDLTSNTITVRANRPGIYDIITITGRILNAGIEIPGNTPTEIDVSTIPPGIYVLVARSPGFGRDTKKIIIAQ